MNNTETINPYILNIVITSIKGLSDMDKIEYFSESMRFSAIKIMVKDLLQQFQIIGVTPPIEALQINNTQVLSFFNRTAEIISVEEAEQSDKRYLSLSDLTRVFGLNLNVKTFDFDK